LGTVLYNTDDKCQVGFLNLLIVKWLIRQTKTSIKPRQEVSKHKLTRGNQFAVCSSTEDFV